jgi:DNA-binding XRE family transcriptional regulator
MASKHDDIATTDSRAIDPKTLTLWRERMGYTQRDAAEALGCSRAAWQNWETGLYPCPIYIGLAMNAEMMGVGPYGGRSRRKPHPRRPAAVR